MSDERVYVNVEEMFSSTFPVEFQFMGKWAVVELHVPDNEVITGINKAGLALANEAESGEISEDALAFHTSVLVACTGKSPEFCTRLLAISGGPSGEIYQTALRILGMLPVSDEDADAFANPS